MTDLYGLIPISLILSLIDDVFGRECYNYRQKPRVRDCAYGCCGNDYEEYCCNATLQIVGSAIGGLIVLSIMAAAAYYCYRQKTKNRQRVGGPTRSNGILGRLGMRSNRNSVAQVRQTAGVHHRGPQRVSPPHIGQMHQQPQGQWYNPTYINSIQVPGAPQNGYMYPPNNIQSPALGPTAPMAPPYQMAMAPPPYAPIKAIPPPPEYNTVVSRAGPDYKYGGYNTMPPPAD